MSASGAGSGATAMQTVESRRVQHSQQIRLLRRQWRRAAACGLLLLLAVFLPVGRSLPMRFALQWAVQAAAVFGGFMGMVYTRLRLNHCCGQTKLLPALGPGNRVSILRGILISMLAGFLFIPAQVLMVPGTWLGWLPGGIYLTVVCADFIDGYLARRYCHETRLGEMLDIELDALGLLIASILAIGYGRLPMVYAAVGAVYYVYKWGIGYRRGHQKTVVVLPPRPTARAVAGFQMGFVALALLPLFSAQALVPAAYVMMVPLLAGFAFDWLLLCGCLKTTAQSLLFVKMQPVFSGLLLFLRVTVSVLLLMFLLSEVAPLLVRIVGAILSIMLLMGWLGRSAALLLSLILADLITRHGDGAGAVMLLGAALVLMVTGPGNWCLWRPEERLLRHKFGVPAGCQPPEADFQADGSLLP